MVSVGKLNRNVDFDFSIPWVPGLFSLRQVYLEKMSTHTDIYILYYIYIYINMYVYMYIPVCLNVHHPQKTFYHHGIDIMILTSDCANA